MWYSTLIFKNIVRRPLRSCLTIIAIAIAIGAVVSLVGIARGFEGSFLKLYDKLNVDLIVMRSGRPGNGGRNRLPETLVADIRKIPGIKDVIPGIVDMLAFDQFKVPSAVVNGWEPETLAFEHIKVVDGRMLTKKDKNCVMLGSVLARNMGLKVGDTFDLIEKAPVNVVGIFESFSVYDNGSMVLPLSEAQRLLDRKGEITGFSIVLTPDGKTHIDKIRDEIQAIMPNIQALPIREHLKSLTELQIAKAMAWLTSTIALIIGLFGMMNTMVMSVHERTREIGILRAVGWRPRRVLHMVLFEAVFLSQMGALVGVLGSLVILKGLTRVPMVNGMIEGQLNYSLVAWGFVIAGFVGLVGGILPAIRAARLLPTAALRQE